MSDVRDVVIVGGGLAAAKAAEALRDEGFDGAVTIFADEPHAPYERPPLSKGYLLGTQEADDAAVHDPGFYAERSVDVRVSEAVVDLDLAAGQVVTRGCRRQRFDRLLLATGAAARRLRIEGSSLDGVLYLRTLDDATRLRQRMGEVGHLTVIGAGWIGSEVTAAARQRGVAVTLVDPVDVPLARVLGPEVGGVFRDLHHDHGVDLRLGRTPTGFAGTTRVEQVTLDDGTTIGTDLVVVGIGVAPRDELARQADLPVDNGVLVDERLQTTDPRVFAAGDVARAAHPLYGERLRVEHWANALHQGVTAGRNLLGAGQAYDRVPYFFTDQYDLGMEYCGHAPDWDQVVIRGDLSAREFIAFWLREGRVRAAMNCNVWDVADDLQALIRSGATVDPARLADVDLPLADLAPIP